MSRKRIIGVIGDANFRGDENKEEISYQIGKLLIDNGFLLATGGLGGVMESASKGAKNSTEYHDGMIIGVTPDYIDSNDNEYLDIVIPTGMGLARNVILSSMCDAVIAIGGGAGTLSEIALAWQMGKLIVAYDVHGWSRNIKSINLDKRREDRIFSAESPEEVISIILENIEEYPKKFSGVQKGRVGKKTAISMIEKNYEIKGELEFLGKGSEGYVFRDVESVYKVIDNDHPLLSQYWRLKSLSECVDNTRTEYVFPFDVEFTDKAILIRYDHSPSKPYMGGKLRHLRFLAKELKRIGWLITDFQPKNIRIRVKDGRTIIIDIGHSFEPYHEDLFRKMCRRMFVSSLIGERKDIKPYLSETNDSEEFHGLKDLGFDSDKLKKDFLTFFNKVMGTDKKDILNPLVVSLVNGLDDVRTIFDYGSGYGDISSSLNEHGYNVT